MPWRPTTLRTRLPRLAATLPILGLLLLPAPAAAQTTPVDCQIAGSYGFPVAVGFFAGDAWDNLGDNQIGFGFATDRPIGYQWNGSWSVTVDWDDGTPTQSFNTGDTASGGPLPSGLTAPPVWLVHTYTEPAWYDVHVTASGTLKPNSDGSGPATPCATDFTSTFAINNIEVLPPPPEPPPAPGANGGGDGSGSGGGSGGPGGGPPPPPACPAAELPLLRARIWNGMAQQYRGKSIEAGQAVIDHANKGNAAFWAAFGITAANLADDKIKLTEGVARELARKEQLEGYAQLWQNSLNGKWPEISRQLRVLTEMQKFLKALGPIGNFEAGLHISEGLYYLGLAAQQGVLRDSWDALADHALANAAEQQRSAERACVTTARRTTGVFAGAAMKASRKLYAKLAKPHPVKGFRVRPGAGLNRGAALALNKLLAGQERTVALAQVVEESVSRARAAAKARSKKWEARQLRHARTTARKLAAHLDGQAHRREQTAGSLSGQARETATIEITNPGGLAKLLRKLGLPDPVTDTLKRLGLRPGPFQRLFTKPPAGQLTVPSLADAVADTAGVASDRAWAKDLRSFAAGP
jgi:hypothetical protein